MSSFFHGKIQHTSKNCCFFVIFKKNLWFYLCLLKLHSYCVTKCMLFFNNLNFLSSQLYTVSTHKYTLRLDGHGFPHFCIFVEYVTTHDSCHSKVIVITCQSTLVMGWQVAIPPRGPAWGLGCGYIPRCESCYMHISGFPCFVCVVQLAFIIILFHFCALCLTQTKEQQKRGEREDAWEQG